MKHFDIDANIGINAMESVKKNCIKLKYKIIKTKALTFYLRSRIIIIFKKTNDKRRNIFEILKICG